MKKLKILMMSLVTVFALSSCGGGENKASGDAEATASTTETSTSADAGKSGGDYDPQRGLGKWDESNVDVSKFDPAMAEAGKKIAEVKCTSCHKPTDEKLVGPGWKGVTTKHKPYWIMNFISNPDPMINVDPELQAQLEICLVRMPNQGLSDTDAREILEYMRQIDGAK
ncbi:c-type cytochrome [Elizabethkingia sp. JS20170427COW]|uniref:c-type cytochrome n=1 Tax=Elizabethkingia sp. JS20170427COW TaxID=2583851 RepID=UPI00111049F3|nr:c-type cytochrome [Elizabethkingia sp. JS20170427COW]QCX53811.1 cytochrome c [Elizabethkingia sp. JS20170427COW]